MVKLKQRPFYHSDIPFFQDVLSDSPKWRKNESGDLELPDFMEQYEDLSGQWQIWELDNRPAAITYHIESAPSNQKPWLGTILVPRSERRKGIAAAVISHLASGLKEKGHKAIFAGVPIEEYEWSNFLSDCGFEQFKTEQSNGDTYLVMVLPL